MTGAEDIHTPHPEGEPRETPRIYAASLTDYNAGILHGQWIDAAVETSEAGGAIEEMLASSPTPKRYGEEAEEWAIHDYDGYGPLRLGEYEPLEKVCAIGRGIARHGEAFAAWLRIRDSTEDIGSEAFEEAYQGEFDSIEEYGEQILDDIGLDPYDLPDVPEGLRPYVTIDVAAWVRDMSMGGEIETVESRRGVYVFC